MAGGSEKGKPNKMTIDEVAKALGVSATTVSRALSGKGRIGENTRQRVLEYAREHGYRPNAERSSSGKIPGTGTIAIVLPEGKELVDQPFFYTCMYGVNEMAMVNGYDMLVITAGGLDITHLKRVISARKADGVILARTYRADPFAAYLRERRIPFVAVGSLDDDGGVQVDHDHRGACRDLTSILISRKMNRIAYLGSSDGKIVDDERYAGYLQACEDAGLAVDRELVSREETTVSGMQKKVEQFLERKADCILCQDDAVCNIVLKELRSRNVRVPEDIRVASCYNSKLLENYPVSVTTLNFDVMESGRTACRLLLDLISGRPVPRKTVLDYEVLLKDSTK